LLLVLGAGLTRSHGHFTEPASLSGFWFGIGVMSSGFVLSWRLSVVPVVWFWGVAIVTRLLLLPMEPGDDLWRYIWEGQIQNLGFSPYHFAPNAPELEPYRPIWWSQINHPDVTTIYPPLTQFGFRGLAALAPQPLLFKVGFVLADLMISGLLKQRWGAAQAILYAWNPLIIYTFAGGAHYDSWFLLPLVAGWLWFERRPWQTAKPQLHESQLHESQLHESQLHESQLHELPASLRWGGSALLIGISVAIKWVSLPILVFLVVRSLTQLKMRQTVWIGLLGLLPFAWSVLPFCQLDHCPLIPTESVFVSYGRSAEFIPDLVARIWPLSLQANWIYAFPLALFTGWLLLRAPSLLAFIEWYWFGLLTLSPIVHAWYFSWLVPFAVPHQNWGVRLVSLSSFIYFVLPSRLPDWRLTTPERLLLWLPFVCGWFWTAWHMEHPTRPSQTDNT
jgi:hypothetical protein